MAVLLFFGNSVDASADVLNPGYKPLSFCYEIENIQDYPNHLFFLFEARIGNSIDQIKSGDCLGFYKLGDATFYAIEKDDFDEEAFLEDQYAYFQDNTNALPGSYKPQPYGNVLEGDPLEKIETILEITELNADRFELEEIETIEHFSESDGSILPGGEAEKNSFINWSKVKFYLIPLVSTIFFECLVYLIFIRKKPLKIVGKCALIQILTNPLANYVFLLTVMYYPISFYAIEVGVIVVEIFLIKWLFKLNYKKAIALSILANVITAAISFVFPDLMSWLTGLF